MPWDTVLPGGALQAVEDDPALGGMNARAIQRTRGFCVDRTGQIEWSIQLDELPVPFQGWPLEHRDRTRRAPGAVRLERMLQHYLARHQLLADISDVYHQAQHPDRGYLRIRMYAQATAALHLLQTSPPAEFAGEQVVAYWAPHRQDPSPDRRAAGSPAPGPGREVPHERGRAATQDVRLSHGAGPASPDRRPGEISPQTQNRRSALVGSLPPGSLEAWDNGGQAPPDSGRGFLPPVAGEPLLPGASRPEPPLGSTRRSGSPHNKFATHGPDPYPASAAVPACPGSSSGAPAAQAPSEPSSAGVGNGPSGPSRPEASGDANAATPAAAAWDSPVPPAAAAAGAAATSATHPPDVSGTLPHQAPALSGRAPRHRVRIAALAAEAWLARDGAQLPLHLRTPDDLADLLAEVTLALIATPGRDP